MELVLFTTLLWLAAAHLFITIRKNEVVRSIIIYFIYTILTVSSFEVISLNEQLIHSSQDIVKSLSAMTYRNLISPFVVLIFVNYFYRQTGYKKAVPVILLILLITLLEYVDLKLQLYTYIKWNFGLTFLLSVSFIIFALIIGKCVNAIQLRGEK